MRSFRSQVRQVLRRLSRAPIFTVATLITLGAGVGASTAVFSVVEGVLLKPLPYPQPERLVGVWHTAPAINIKDLNASPSTYFIYRDQNRTFQDIGLFTGDSVSVTGVAEPERVQALLVTDGTLPILGIPPMLGRWFTREDDSPSSPDTVMLTYGYWRRKFGADSRVIGRSIKVDGKPREIVGVLPQRFHFLFSDDPPLILPLKFDRNKTHLGNFSYQAVARLRTGATIAEANADVARMLPIVTRSFPAPQGFSLKLFEEVRIGPNVRPLKQDVLGDVGGVLWVLMGSVGVVLLIACANVANLLLVGGGSPVSCCSRASFLVSREAHWVWDLPMPPCAFWCRWRRPGFRDSTKSALMPPYCCLPSRCHCLEAFSLVPFRFSNTRACRSGLACGAEGVRRARAGNGIARAARW